MSGLGLAFPENDCDDLNDRANDYAGEGDAVEEAGSLVGWVTHYGRMVL
jgi:hypothetical protein